MLVDVSSSRAKALVPPNLSTISEAVMRPVFAENANQSQVPLAFFVNAYGFMLRQTSLVFDTKELLARLDSAGVKNREIARVLGINDSRVTEIKKGQRSVKLDEAVKLVQAFGLEQDQVTPLPPSILRLVALHIARSLGAKASPDDLAMRELLADLEAFSRFVADPQVRESIEAAEGFFRAMELRPRAGSAAKPEIVL